MAGTVTVTTQEANGQRLGWKDSTKRFYVKIEWVADAADGSVPDTNIGNFDAYLIQAVTDPGSVAPTANYDISLDDDYGVDVMGTALNDRSATATEQAMPLVAGCPVPRLVKGSLTFKLVNNSVNSATGTCYVYFQV